MPDQPLNIFVVLPAYNEARNVPPILGKLKILQGSGRNIRAVLVDDGSTDGTADAASRNANGLSLDIVKHPKNLGLGSALRTGLVFALSRAQDDDVIVTLDADNSHDPALIPQLIEQLNKGADCAIASRYARGAQQTGLSFHRRWGSFGIGLLLKMALPIAGVRDYSCGYRAYRAAILKKLSAKTAGELFKENSFACQVDLLAGVAEMGGQFSEAPLDLRYDLKEGASKMNIGRTLIRYGALLWRRRFK